jgi:hypothetical protein
VYHICSRTRLQDEYAELARGGDEPAGEDILMGWVEVVLGRDESGQQVLAITVLGATKASKVSSHERIQTVE